MTISKIIRRLLLTAIALNTAACTTALFYKFDRQRYETLYYGQPYYAVEDTMGKPTEIDERQWIYIHESPYYRAVITYDAEGKLANKEWFLAEDEPDVNPAGQTPTGD